MKSIQKGVTVYIYTYIHLRVQYICHFDMVFTWACVVSIEFSLYIYVCVYNVYVYKNCVLIEEREYIWESDMYITLYVQKKIVSKLENVLCTLLDLFIYENHDL